MIKTTFKLLAASLVLGGCAPAAMTPNEFRDQVRQSNPQQHDTYVVNRSVEQVAGSFRRKARECLNFEIKGVSGGLNYGDTWTEVSAKTYVTKSGSKYILIMQATLDAAVATGPKDGYYMLVVDAAPAGANKTRVDAYIGLNSSFQEAIRSWANGNERGCPDQLRMFER